MSAQSQHGFRQFLTDIATVLGLRPQRYVQHVYPFLPKPEAGAGRGWSMVQPTGALRPVTMQAAIPEDQLTIEQRNRLAGNLTKAQISAIATVKNLSPERLPDHVVQNIPAASGMLPGMNEVRRRLSAPKLQSIPIEQVSKPFWVEQLQPPAPPVPPQQPKVEPAIPDWIVEEMPTKKQTNSGFLLASEVILSEEEMQPDLSEEDDEATLLRPVVKKENH